MGAVIVSDGTAYMMIGGAVMTSGDNLLDCMRTDDLLRWADRLKKDVIKKMPEIMSELKERGIEVIEPIVLRLRIDDDSEKHWFLVDDNDRFEIPITGPWK